jgi:hypothetical protein
MSKYLEIGSGSKPHEGYETIEIQEKFHPTYLGDFRTMSFTDIDTIRAEHLLEHFGRDESIQVLKLWHDWLKMGGVLIVETPDFEGICEMFMKCSKASERYWLIRHTYGSQEADWAYHKEGWYEDRFRRVLPYLGFEIIDFTHTVSRGYLKNIKVRARKIK